MLQLGRHTHSWRSDWILTSVSVDVYTNFALQCNMTDTFLVVMLKKNFVCLTC